MPNPIKYTTGTETLALKKGNFYIGTGDVGKGPSDTTGYYQGPNVPSGGYVIYLNKEGAPGGLSYHSAANDAQLIAFTNNLAGQSYTTVNECLVYFDGQSDKVVLNRDYEGIVTDGLVFNVDAGFTPSYPKSGTTWYGVSLSGNNGTLINGPTFSTDGGGSIVFDGTNDYASFGDGTTLSLVDEGTVSYWLYFNPNSYSVMVGKRNNNSTVFNYAMWIGGDKKFDIDNSPSGSFKPFYDLSSEISVGDWIYITVVFNNGQTSFYLNGQHKITRTLSLGPTTTEPLLLGRNSINGTQYSKGNMAIVQIYNRALSATEVLQNFNAQKGRFGL
jgi:hypothetical protein